MQKRGQVTMFIILGLSVLIILLFAWFFKDTFEMVVYGEEGVKRVLSEQLTSIDDGIKKCIDQYAIPALDLLGKQGGSFDPSSSLPYYGGKVAILCHNIPDDKKCLNDMLIKKKLEDDLNSYLENKIKVCAVDLIGGISGKGGYTLTTGDFGLSTKINDRNVLFNITYPITIKRNDIVVNKEEFLEKVDVPLGLIIVAVNDILNSEAKYGAFDSMSYDMTHLDYFIKPGRTFNAPNRVYIVQVVPPAPEDEKAYKFYVGIESEFIYV